MKSLRRYALAGALACAAPLAAADIDVKTGGVGQLERAEMMRSFGEYNLHLAFAEQRGAFLADVEVAIRDARGNELWRGTADGPMVFARVPSGRYTVSAEFNGEKNERQVQVGSAPGRIEYMHWRLADMQNFREPPSGGAATGASAR